MKKFYLNITLLVMILNPSITFGDVIDKLNETGRFIKFNETLTKENKK